MRFLKYFTLGWLLFSFSLGAHAADLVLPDMGGKDHSLSEFRGKWVVLNFWATWCPPCIDEMPELERFYEAHKDRNAVVIGVNMEDVSIDILKAFVDDMFITYPIWLAPPDGTTTLGRISALPTTLLISPQGELVGRRVGGITAEMIERMIEKHAHPQRQASNSKKRG
ncbi:MAG: TlpA family protein disulfide reductase [Sedimenticola sp.]|nr:TlpA family protein disulfide reductase [Sedimenticola sp.]MCW8921555.1 TlpA family protein disulfide reductase [Sedimenticola sp.]MCW8950866.1 TlpA family protein disulfide reductase [Sedimenticola sp.]